MTFDLDNDSDPYHLWKGDQFKDDIEVGFLWSTDTLSVKLLTELVHSLELSYFNGIIWKHTTNSKAVTCVI